MRSTRIAVIILMGIMLVSGLSCGSDEWRLLTYTEGEGTISPAEGNFSHGAELTLTAIPESGWDFDHWGGQINGTVNPITINMDSDKTIYAYFVVKQNVVLYSDDFSDPYSGWPTYSDDEGSVFYLDGWLHVRDAAFSRYDEGTSAGVHFTDIILDVETKLVSGTNDNWHSVICRANDPVLGLLVQGYCFYISTDGYYEIFKIIDDERIFIKEATYSGYINTGKNVTNLIHIECIGSTLSLSVNGHLLTEQTDHTFASGDLYLGADTMGSQNDMEVAFDNLVVTTNFERYRYPPYPGHPYWEYFGRQPPYTKSSSENQIHLINNDDATDPTWQQLKTFIISDRSDDKLYNIDTYLCGAFAEEVHNNAEEAGIKAAWVAIGYEDDETGHAINAFMTVDQGLVFVDCTGTSDPSNKDSRDTIAYVEQGMEYGLISLDIVEGFSYSYYQQYMNEWEAYANSLVQYYDDLDAYNSVNYSCGDICTDEGGECNCQRLWSWYDKLELWENQLDRQYEELGESPWESGGIVKEVTIWW